MKRHVIIIGGGASGMTAAIFAARQGARVTLLEHTDRVGKKILSTGNGKCNLSNKHLNEACYRSGVLEFPMKVLSRFGVKQTVEFFEELGIVIKDRDGYLYPYSGQASSVLDVMKAELERCRVTTITGCAVERISVSDKGCMKYAVHTSMGKMDADAVILATGSKAAPATGSDGSGYELSKSLGLKVKKPLPALVQLKCREKFYKQISGVRAEAAVTIVSDGITLARDEGELQLTDYGISGIPVFQVSRFAAVALDEGKKVEAVLDFFPQCREDELKKMVEERLQHLNDGVMELFFTGWFNKKLALLFLKLAGIGTERLGTTVTVREKEQLISLIKEFRTQVTATNSFENAQITCGGVDVADINAATLEVKNRKGLYLTGELLDVDGICGGYNLQWAWSTGAIAGTAAAGAI